MGVVSVRIPEDQEATLAKAGLSPAEIAKKAIANEAQVQLVKQQMAVLERHRFKSAKSAARLVRETRDEH